LKIAFSNVSGDALRLALMGGFAPNYTPTCLTDGASGFIIDTITGFWLRCHEPKKNRWI
jgi:hypothetical protein